jgi:3-oxoacyl-[acyl-carrier protein] reductase
MSATPSKNNRHIIISGGSRGLGKAIVEGLLEAGYCVSTFIRKSSSFIDQMAGNKRLFYAPADLSDGASISSFLKTSEAAFGLPFGLINCAAIAADGLLATTSESTIRQLVSVNVEGTLRFTRLIVRRMMRTESGAVILNISSINSIRGFKGLAAYAFTKGGLDSFTRALARDLGSTKIPVNPNAPAYYDTEMTHNLNDKQKEQILRRTPLGRLGVPEDVVGAVLFLLSDQASFITGQMLVIDGGNTV